MLFHFYTCGCCVAEGGKYDRRIYTCAQHPLDLSVWPRSKYLGFAGKPDTMSEHHAIKEAVRTSQQIEENGESEPGYGHGV